MKKHLFIIGVVFSLSFFTSCSDQLCEQEVTYTKATAIYADLNDFRIDNLNESPKQLESANKIYLSNDLILISERMKGIHVYDNSDPKNPIAINFLNIPGNNEMFVEDNIIYADSYYDMLKIDISSPLQATVVSRLENAIRPQFSNDRGQILIGFNEEIVTEQLSCDAYIDDNNSIYFDWNSQRIDDSAIPTAFVSNSNGSLGTANRIAKVDDLIFIIDKTNIFTLEDREKLSEATIPQSIGWALETIYPADGHLFLGSNNGMQIYRIQDDNRVSLRGEFFHATGCDPVLPTDQNVAYVTLRSGDECPGDENNISVVNIANLNSPSLIQEIAMDSPYGMTLHEDKLYVGEGTNGFKIFDASERDNLKLIETNRSIETYDIIVHPTDRNILLFANPNGISQYATEGQDYNLLSSITY